LKNENEIEIIKDFFGEDEHSLIDFFETSDDYAALVKKLEFFEDFPIEKNLAFLKKIASEMKNDGLIDSTQEFFDLFEKTQRDILSFWHSEYYKVDIQKNWR